MKSYREDRPEGSRLVTQPYCPPLHHITVPTELFMELPLSPSLSLTSSRNWRTQTWGVCVCVFAYAHVCMGTCTYRYQKGAFPTLQESLLGSFLTHVLSRCHCCADL